MALDLSLFAKKLGELKSQLEYSSEELCLLSGIEASRLSSLENSVVSPSGDEILILADIFNIDYAFLINNEVRSTLDKTKALYRKFGSKFTKDDKRLIQEFIYQCETESFLERELGRQKKEFTFEKKTEFEKQQGIDAANQLREFLYKDERFAISKDIFFDFRKLGLHIFRKNISSPKISGMCLIHQSAGMCVLINFNEDPYRQRFSVAHEVGHSILDDFADDILVTFEGGDGNSKNNNYSEVRANNFASTFLIPTAFLNKLKEDKIKIKKENFLNYCHTLKVNAKTLAFSMKDVGLLDRQQSQIFGQISISSSEKSDDEIPKSDSQKIQNSKLQLLKNGLSDYYIRLCHEAYEKDIISKGRLAEAMLTTEEGLMEILNLFSLRL
jgi:Zn-dependent peptidase ImmA (M78 family)